MTLCAFKLLVVGSSESRVFSACSSDLVSAMYDLSMCLCESFLCTALISAKMCFAASVQEWSLRPRVACLADCARAKLFSHSIVTDVVLKQDSSAPCNLPCRQRSAGSWTCCNSGSQKLWDRQHEGRLKYHLARSLWDESTRWGSHSFPRDNGGKLYG